ncbi:MAG TPA: FecR domain-containing protein [Verrucomicrobiae bacterium]|nr:FecR domain-containing protein [Verrucomicrobiae bacterium]
MKILSHAVSLICVGLLVVVILAADAFAASVSLSSSSGNGYALVTVTSAGFTSYSNDFYNTGFYIDGNWTGQSCPGSAGPDSSVANCSLPIRMPITLGPHAVTGRNPVPPTGETGTATYSVVAPTCSVVPTCGPPGTPVTVTGHNYPATYPVGIWFDGGFSGISSNASEAGDVTITFPMPAYPYGNHTISVHSVIPTIDSVTFTISTNCAGFVAFVVGSKGATVTHPDGSSGPLQPAQGLEMGDVIETGAGQSVSVQAIDDTQFTLGQNAKLTVDEYVYDPDTNAGSAHYSFLRGLFVYTSGLIGHNNPDGVHVQVPAGDLGIRGTEFIVQIDPCSTTQEVDLIDGELGITPQTSGVTNIVDAPVTVRFDTSAVTTSALTQAAFDSLSNQYFQTTGAVTFAAWQIQYFGCTNNNPAADPGADPDGDGQNNMTEFLTGTDPTNAASAFRIVSALRESNNVRVVWSTHGGVTNAVQTAASVAGAYTNLSGNIVIAGGSDTTTNYLDVGGVTNTPGRLYRVRLVP